MAQQDTAEKSPPGKEKEADPSSSSSSLSGQPRPDQTRRRSWRQRAQDSGSQAAKPIRLNRVPLLRPESRNESSRPCTSSQGLPGLCQGLVLGSSSSLPCRKQSLKRGHPEGATEPQTPASPAAKRRRIHDAPAQRAGTSSSSTAPQVAPGLSQDTQPPSTQAAPYTPAWLFPGSTKDNRSQPGPIRMRHVWRQQRRAKKPYSRPDNQSRSRQAPAPAAHPPQPSK